MKILSRMGRDDLATVFVGETDSGRRLEFVESVQPPKPMREKWVNIISTSYGCPVGCSFCDAGGEYHGAISAEDMLAQINVLVRFRFDTPLPETGLWKIQFARMGEPSLNNAVLDVLRQLPKRYPVDGLMPCVSTVAPSGRDPFFEELLELRHRLFPQHFQLQFSIHTLDWEARKRLVPVKTWTPEQIAEYAARFHVSGGRKVSLNFALTPDAVLTAKRMREYFNPELFLIKLTPINPTFRAQQHGVANGLVSETAIRESVQELVEAGYPVLISIGELEENQIGSNCGQYVSGYAQGQQECKLDAYSYVR